MKADRLVWSLMLVGIISTLAALPQMHAIAVNRPENPGLAINRLPVSLSDVMTVLVNHTGAALQSAASTPPETDEAWRALEHNARQLQVAGVLLKTPGTGELDGAWAGDPRWQEFADQLSAAASRAESAMKSRNLHTVDSAIQQIANICDGCHEVFRPTTSEPGSIKLDDTQ